MHWRDKFIVAQKYARHDSLLRAYFDWNDTGAAKHNVKSIVEQHPSCPDCYSEFLLLSDGAYIGHNEICGSSKSKFYSILKAQRAWEDYLNCDQFVFGVSQDNAAFICMKTESITWSYREDFPGIVVASSMEEFLGEVLMGKLYGRLFPRGFSENEWTQFLRNQHWL